MAKKLSSSSRPEKLVRVSAERIFSKPISKARRERLARLATRSLGGMIMPCASSLFGLPARPHGMVIGMATTKITITLDDNQLQEVRAIVAAGQAASVSAFVKHAVAVALSDAAGWQEMLSDALEQTGGPLTKTERAWADGILSPRRRSSRRGKAA